jgi:hypothetical protein
MKHKIIISATIFLLLFSCNNGGNVINPSEESRPEEIYLSDLIDIEKIDSVLMNNNYGVHFIDNSKLANFKSELGKMTLEGGSYKMGGISFAIYINGIEYHFVGRTKGTLIEASSNVVTINKSWIGEEWIYFKTNDLNLDNY